MDKREIIQKLAAAYRKENTMYAAAADEELKTFALGTLSGINLCARVLGISTEEMTEAVTKASEHTERVDTFE